METRAHIQKYSSHQGSYPAGKQPNPNHEPTGLPHILYRKYTTYPFFVSLSLHIYIYVYWLVVLTTLKNISQFGRIIPYIMENKTCSKPPTSIYIYVYVYKLDSQRSACLNPKFSSPISAMLWVSPAWTASEQRTAETPTAVPNLGETALSPAAQNPWCLAYGFD